MSEVLEVVGIDVVVLEAAMLFGGADGELVLVIFDGIGEIKVDFGGCSIFCEEFIDPA